MSQDAKHVSYPYQDTILERHKYWVTEHKTCQGRVQAMYIRRDRKWLKIGEVCTRCGETAFTKEFDEEINKKRKRFNIES